MSFAKVFDEGVNFDPFKNLVMLDGLVPAIVAHLFADHSLFCITSRIHTRMALTSNSSSIAIFHF